MLATFGVKELSASTWSFNPNRQRGGPWSSRLDGSSPSVEYFRPVLPSLVRVTRWWAIAVGAIRAGYRA